MKKSKKLIAMFLSLAIIVCVFQLPVFAAGAEAAWFLRSAKKGEGTFDEAMNQADRNGSVRLLKNVTANTYSVAKSLTLTSMKDKKTLENGVFNLQSGTLTIENIKMNNTKINVNDGRLVLSDNAELVNVDLIVSSGALIIKGGKFSGKIKLEGGTASLNMTGGIITGCNSAEPAVSLKNGATATITGGKITGNTNTSSTGAVYVESSELTVGANAFIYGNSDSQKENNIYLAGSSSTPVVTVEPQLDKNAKIGITTKKVYPADAKITFVNAASDLTGRIYDDRYASPFYYDNGSLYNTKTVLISFELQKGECDTTPIIRPVGKPVGKLPTPNIREGASFKGWFDEEGTKYDESTPAPDKSELLLKGEWIEEPTRPLGMFIERIGRLLQIIINFLKNLFSGTGNQDIVRPGF